MPRPSSAQSARAEARLDGEPLFPLHVFDGYHLVIGGVSYHPPAKQLLRWGAVGKSGVCLDVIYSDTMAAYVTSRAALARFVAEVEAATATPHPTS